MIAFLFTPIGRYLAIAAVILAVVAGAYFKIRSDAVAEIEADSNAELLRRQSDAIRAGDNVDNSADGMRKPDPYLRKD